MKTALLVMVHGSPRPIANTPMFQVVEEVKARGVFDQVEVGFMECNEPTITESIDACAAAGAEKVIAVPYFLHTGTHVADDLPTLLEEAAARHPQVQFQMGRYIGTSPKLTDILSQRAESVMLQP
ncbi:MAG: sirohydrochlorin chelatase [Janthinobacterium lividum]